MPYHIVPEGGRFQVVGDFKGQSGHVYGTHDSPEQARSQQRALYANTDKTAKLTMTALPHQGRVADRLDDKKQDGLLAMHGLGSGKTFTSINAADKLKLPILAIVPAPLRNNYRKELVNSGFKGESTVVSYQEALDKIDDPKFRAQAAKSLVTFDEAHRMGHSDSQRSRLSTDLPAKKKLLLTATPIRNDPTELAPLINAVRPGALPMDPEEFRANYLHTREVPVGFWGRVLGAKPGKTTHPVNLEKFRKAVHGTVDHYEAVDRSDFPSSSESIVEVPMSAKQQAAYDFTMGKYPTLAYKIAHGLPMHRSEETNFRAFMIGPRQISNHPGGFNKSAGDKDAPKIRAAADQIEERYKKDKNFRGVAYSGFLDAGVHPLARELKKRDIPHAVFSGEVKDTDRKKIIEDYNTGKVPLLIISGAGAEGLDLKGTKLMQIMEPHWQEEMINQVRGRAIRYKSHSHLPSEQRHVEVQRFHAIPRPNFFERMIGRTRSKQKGVDEYIHENAHEKQHINEPFLKILREEADAKTSGLRSKDAPKAWSSEPKFEDGSVIELKYVDDERYPGLLVDLDQTLTHTDSGAPGPRELGEQQVMPRRKEILKIFKDRGYKIVGVTNRSVYPQDHGFFDLHTLQAVQEEALHLFEGLLDDIIYLPIAPSQWHKPAPTMLLYAMHDHQLDPENTVMVGDSHKDEEAAKAAGVPFVKAENFFADVDRYKDLPEAAPVKIAGIADWMSDKAWDAPHGSLSQKAFHVGSDIAGMGEKAMSTATNLVKAPVQAAAGAINRGLVQPLQNAMRPKIQGSIPQSSITDLDHQIAAHQAHSDANEKRTGVPLDEFGTPDWSKHDHVAKARELHSSGLIHTGFDRSEDDHAYYGKLRQHVEGNPELHQAINSLPAHGSKDWNQLMQARVGSDVGAVAQLANVYRTQKTMPAKGTVGALPPLRKLGAVRAKVPRLKNYLKTDQKPLVDEEADEVLHGHELHHRVQHLVEESIHHALGGEEK